MLVQLDVGWMKHPFPSDSFRIDSLKQIETLKTLGVRYVHCVPEKSDSVLSHEPDLHATELVASEALLPSYAAASAVGASGPAARDEATAAARVRTVLECERAQSAAAFGFGQVVALLPSDAQAAGVAAAGVVDACVDELLADGEPTILLLQGPARNGDALHAVNLMVLSLLLGKASGMFGPELRALGSAALLHDLGAAESQEAQVTTSEESAVGIRLAPGHVAAGVAAARLLKLPDDAVRAVAEHHELVDGTGFPAGLRGEEMSQGGKILSLVNRYEDLCNPNNGYAALEPYDALSTVFGTERAGFDARMLGLFIRMMGLYPPGSLVQLVDDRHALVVAVNSARPLRPRLLVHDPMLSPAGAIALDLEQAPDLAIRRAVRADKVAATALELLAPPAPLRYFLARESAD